MILVATFVALALLSINLAGVSNAQTETETPVPGAGGDPGGPAAPVLTAHPGYSWITVSWEPVSGADKYEIWSRQGTEGTWRESSASPHSNTSHGFLGLPSGSTWQFLVRSIAADGKVSAWSELVQATVSEAPTPTPTPTPGEPDTPVPGAGGDPDGPAAPVLTAHPGHSWITVSWEPVSGADKYEIWSRQGTEGTWRESSASPHSNTSHGFLGLPSGSTWQFLVRSIAADGRVSAWSGLAEATVSDAPTPTPTPTPTATALAAPVLTASALGPNEIELRWTSVPGAVRYVLYVQLVDAPGWQQIGGGNLQGTSHTHGELTPGKAYQFAVRGIDANDQPLGPWSNFPIETIPASDAPTSTATPTPTPGATPTATPTPTHGPTPTTTSTPTHGATPTATPAATSLTAPALTATFVGSNEIELRWTSVPGAARYVLFTQLVDNPGWQQLDSGDLREASFRHRGLTPGKTYQYAVRAIDANSQPLGPWSAFPTETVPASDAPTATPTSTSTATSSPGATPTATPPSAPVLTATSLGSNEIELNWTSVPGAVRYVLWTQLVDDPGWLRLDGGNLQATTHRHRELTPGKTYQYAVRAVDGNNELLGPWSNFPTETVPESDAPTARQLRRQLRRRRPQVRPHQRRRRRRRQLKHRLQHRC